MKTNPRLSQFERTVLPHLDAAYNLARWLIRNEHDAEDVVQEAYLRAFRFFDGFEGEDGRAWLLAIVRNTSRTWQQRRSARETSAELDDEKHPDRTTAGPEDRMLRQSDVDTVRSCIDGLPLEYREVVVLRELEELSYKEIACAAAIPVGTVMSRLARARARLLDCLSSRVRRARA